MFEKFYASCDAIVEFIWQWTGLRRRHLFVLGMALNCADIAFRHSWLAILFDAAGLTIATVMFVFEKRSPAGLVNELSLSIRRMIFTRVQLVAYLPLTVLSLAAHSRDGTAALLALGAACLGSSISWVALLALLPTKPRKKIEWPVLVPAPQGV